MHLQVVFLLLQLPGKSPASPGRKHNLQDVSRADYCGEHLIDKVCQTHKHTYTYTRARACAADKAVTKSQGCQSC